MEQTTPKSLSFGALGKKLWAAFLTTCCASTSAYVNWALGVRKP